MIPCLLVPKPLVPYAEVDCPLCILLIRLGLCLPRGCGAEVRKHSGLELELVGVVFRGLE